MTYGEPATPTPEASWRDAFVVACRALLSVALLVALYSTLPYDRDQVGPYFLLIGVWGAVFLGMSVLEVRAIARSRTPGLRGLESLAVLTPMLVLSFSSVYFLMSTGDPSTFSSPLSRVDALYFSLTIFSTVGFGDIAAVSDTARLVVSANIVVNLIALSAGVRIVTGAVQIGRRRATVAPGADA